MHRTDCGGTGSRAHSGNKEVRANWNQDLLGRNWPEMKDQWGSGKGQGPICRGRQLLCGEWTRLGETKDTKARKELQEVLWLRVGWGGGQDRTDLVAHGGVREKATQTNMRTLEGEQF